VSEDAVGFLGCNRKALGGGTSVIEGGREHAETRELSENPVAALAGTGGFWTTITFMGGLCFADIPQPLGVKERESGEKWNVGVEDVFIPRGWSFWLLGIMVYYAVTPSVWEMRKWEKVEHTYLAM
jgi:hypothetical protein